AVQTCALPISQGSHNSWSGRMYSLLKMHLNKDYTPPTHTHTQTAIHCCSVPHNLSVFFTISYTYPHIHTHTHTHTHSHTHTHTHTHTHIHTHTHSHTLTHT